MDARSRIRPPSPLPALLPAAVAVALACRGLGPRDAALLLVLGTLLVTLGTRRASLRRWAAAAALLAALGGLAALAPRGGPGDAPDRRPTGLVRGRLAALEPRPDGVLLRFESGRLVRVPRHGLSRLDRLPVAAAPGARVVVPVRDAPRGAVPIAACAASVRVIAPPPPLDRLRALPGRLRAAFVRHAEHRLAGSLRDPGPGLALALVAGDRSRLLPSVREDLRAAGLAHVAVVSGLHFGLLVGGGLLLLAPGTGPRHPGRALAAMLLALGLLVVLPSAPPVLRAALAALLAGAGTSLGRASDPLARVGAAGFVLLLLDPGLASSVSFQLTLAATWALAAAARGPRRGRELRAALAPFLATWPLLVSLTGRVAPWAPLANLAATPLVPPLLASGWAALLAPGWLPGLCTTLAGLTVLLARILAHVAAAFAGLPGSGALAPAPRPAAGIVHGLALAGWLLLPERARRRRILAATILAVLVARDAGLPLVPPRPVPPGVHVVDVGQGQAVLLAGRGGGTVLLDTGDDRGREGTRALLRHLAFLGVRRLDALVLSHGDRDHAGGAASVLRALPTGRLLLPPGLLDSPSAAALREAATRRGVPVLPVARGFRARYRGVEILVLHPSPGSRTDGNETSLVVLGRVAGLTVLVPGDAGKVAEPAFVPWLRGRHVDLLVPGHHGAGSATGRSLLAAAPPILAAISAGRRNRHGHPHPATVRRLLATGARVSTTARSGTLRVVVSRGRLRILPALPARDPDEIPPPPGPRARRPGPA